jgi:hypothetical protein
MNVDGAHLWRVEIVVVLRDAKRVDLFRGAAAFSAIPVSSTALCRYRANCLDALDLCQLGGNRGEYASVVSGP